jgi:GT2 family glycosyltransferase
MKQGKPVTRAFCLEPQSASVTFEALLVEDCAIGTSTVVVSRGAIMTAGLFDENFRRSEDFDLWLRMRFQGCQMAYHPDAEVVHRVHGMGLSADKWAMKKERIRVYRKVAKTLDISSEQRQIVRAMIAKTEAECDIERLKRALEVGDFNCALQAADRAVTVRNSWKLRVSLIALRKAPRLFRILHLCRSFMLGYSS